MKLWRIFVLWVLCHHSVSFSLCASHLNFARSATALLRVVFFSSSSFSFTGRTEYFVYQPGSVMRTLAKKLTTLKQFLFGLENWINQPQLCFNSCPFKALSHFFYAFFLPTACLQHNSNTMPLMCVLTNHAGLFFSLVYNITCVVLYRVATFRNYLGYTHPRKSINCSCMFRVHWAPWISSHHAHHGLSEV